MRPPHDLMERLAAADPMPDVDGLSPEQQREADALLERLLATPVERRRPRRRWAKLAAATACAAAAAFVALNLLDSPNSPAPSVLSSAVAALTRDDAVYHVVARTHLNASEFPDDKRTIVVESWHTTSGRVHRKTYEGRGGGRGRLYEDFAGRRRPGRRGGPAIRYDAIANTITESGFGRSPGGGGAPGLDPFDPSSGLRELEAAGRLRADGSARVGGRRAYRLVSGTVPGDDGAKEHSEFLVGAETYLPLAQRYSVRFRDGSRVAVFTRFLTYERLPLNDATRAQLDLDPHPGAKCSPFLREHDNPRGPLGFPNPCRR